ncbi:hypothetical protein KIW84_010204 [Lathyrus oleraceus]|uniref:PB1-like domain-containing protein n=1 Tax=Pisum sativum TaxID=3888 RepID=A0A9D4YMQ6_PEA|nr:hypothetical protein KIW84_010204 [Pisum sativum]
MGKLVETHAKWYVNGEVTEMNYSWDVDYMSYMDLKAMMKSESYVNIKCLWYWHLAYSFSRGLRPLNNDQDVLQFSKDVIGYDVIDVYVEHNLGILQIIDDSELAAEDEVQCTGFKTEDVTRKSLLLKKSVLILMVLLKKKIVILMVLLKMAWAAARATTIPAWKMAVLRMKAMKEDAWKDMEKPIITLLEGIKHYITKRMTSPKELLHGYTGSICPRIQLVIEKNKKQTQGWSPTWHGDDDLSIFGITNGIETYYVDLKKEACSCRKKSTYMDTYSNIVYPTNGPQLWPINDLNTLAPPAMGRAIGRPKNRGTR